MRCAWKRKPNKAAKSKNLIQQQHWQDMHTKAIMTTMMLNLKVKFPSSTSFSLTPDLHLDDRPSVRSKQWVRKSYFRDSRINNLIFLIRCRGRKAKGIQRPDNGISAAVVGQEWIEIENFGKGIEIAEAYCVCESVGKKQVNCRDREQKAAKTCLFSLLLTTDCVLCCLRE